MKRIKALLVSLVLVISVVPMAYARKEPNDRNSIPARQLYAAGLFRGIGDLPDGQPDFALYQSATRSQAAIMFVRLLGKEIEALETNYDMPFTDVSPTAAPYVGYLYHNGLANGITSDLFGSQQLVTESQYATFVLRALGYNDPEDFTVSTARAFGENIGIFALVPASDDEAARFTRGYMTYISYNALSTCMKDSQKTLSDVVGVNLFTYQSFLDRIKIGTPTTKRDRGDINITYTVRVNMSFSEWENTNTDALYWYMLRLCKEYITGEDDTYLIFEYMINGEQVGYTYGYPSGRVLGSID